MKRYLLVAAVILLLVPIYLLMKQSLSSVQKKDQVAQKTLTKLKISYIVDDVTEVPVAIAIKNGYFKKYGLDVKAIKSIKSLNSSLLSGESDISVGIPPAFIMAAAEGAEIKTVGTVSNDSPQVFVSYKKPADIKVVGIPRTAGESHLRTLELLPLLGVDVASVNFQVLGTHDVLAKTLAEKKVDGGSFQKGVWLLFKQQNNVSDEFKILAETTNDNKLSKPDIIFVKTAFLKNNKLTISNFAKAMLEANVWVEKNSTEKVASEITEVNGLTKNEAVLLTSLYKASVKNTKFTPDSKRLDVVKSSLTEIAPKTKDFNIENLVSFEVSDVLKKDGFLKQYGF